MANKRRRKKRRRRGGSAGPPAADPADAPPPRRRRAAAEGSPAPPWGSFPLSELVILIALVLLVGGFLVPPPRGSVMIGAGLVLGSLAGLELAVREHFAGYRSHTLLLAAAVGMAVLGAMFVFASDSVAPMIRVAAGLVAFGLAAWAFGGAFRRRSGGALFRIRG